MAKVTFPNGCWFCDNDDEHESLYFEFEFDCYVHKTCLKRVLQDDPQHPEAVLMKYLLESD
jgi:hypothetical protein